LTDNGSQLPVVFLVAIIIIIIIIIIRRNDISDSLNEEAGATVPSETPKTP
jgi:hypothetical protein